MGKVRKEKGVEWKEVREGKRDLGVVPRTIRLRDDHKFETIL